MVVVDLRKKDEERKRAMKVLKLEEKNRKDKEGKKQPAKKPPSLIKIHKQDIIGEGSQGTTVFSGIFQDRIVAIKRILRTQYKLIDKEIEILMRLEHQNIIRLYYYEHSKDFTFLVLEKCVCNIKEFI